jgi:hypothetical protein
VTVIDLMLFDLDRERQRAAPRQAVVRAVGRLLRLFGVVVLGLLVAVAWPPLFGVLVIGWLARASSGCSVWCKRVDVRRW